MVNPVSPPFIYLDHAATTPVSDAARQAMMEGLERWANPSSPHAAGRAARAALEDARGRIKVALGWDGAVIFTSGASEATSIGLTRARAETIVTSPVEHDAVLRVTKGARRLAVDRDGRVTETVPGALHAIQHVNNETGVIQPIAELLEPVRAAGGLLFCDCAQSAGKIDLPLSGDDAPDMIAISACKFGGAPGVGALLVRDLTLLHPSGGQEQGYRGGTENLPGVLAMAAALEEGRDWMTQAARLRALLDEAIIMGGGAIVGGDAPRIPTIASYHMPGKAARAQLIQFDMAGIAVSAGSACSSGTLKTSPVLKAMGWEDKAADEVVRVSLGRKSTEEEVRHFIMQWRKIAGISGADTIT